MRLIVDGDPGIDDALALCWLVSARSEGAVDLAAVCTVAGNVDVDTATANARKVLAAAGALAVPVHRGAERPLVLEWSPRPDWPHGADGLGGLGASPDTSGFQLGPPTPMAATAIIEAVRADPHFLVIALGPLTNVALALAVDDTIAGNLHVVSMGGRFLGAEGGLGGEPALRRTDLETRSRRPPEFPSEAGGLGGEPALQATDLGTQSRRHPEFWSEAVEFNWGTDPHAVRRVSSAVADFTVVPYDVTSTVGFTAADVACLPAGLAHDLLARLVEVRGPVAPVHDAVAAVVAVQPELAVHESKALDINVRDRPGAAVLADAAPGVEVRVATKVDVEGVRAELLRGWGVRGVAP